MGENTSHKREHIQKIPLLINEKNLNDQRTWKEILQVSIYQSN